MILKRMGVDFDVVVVGAGVVGLATAARLAREVPSLLLLERHEGICRETSSRSSEVIHAGFYYPPGSRKARTCVEGRRTLYERCQRLGVPVARTGKIVVATTDAEREKLAVLAERAIENDVHDLELWEGRQLARHAPDVGGIAALYSPASGVVDSHAYAATFRVEAEVSGAEIVLRTEVTGAERIAEGYRLATGPADLTVSTRVVINAAGLGQAWLSRAVGIDIEAAGYRTYPCKGDYFSIAPRHRGRVGALVYPVGRASGPGLGVHLCLDVGGGMRLGPDAEYVDGPPFSYRVDPAKAESFLAEARRILPWLERDDLTPAMSGIRPKLAPPGGGFRDFVVQEESARGLPGWVTLAGIESPGLTAASALAEEITAALKRRDLI